MSALGGLTLDKVEQGGPNAAGEFFYVDIGSIDNQSKRIVDPKRLPVAEAPIRAKQRLRAGDVLVSMTRPNLNAVALVPDELDGSIGSTGFHVLRSKGDVLPKWLFYGVQTRRFIEEMTAVVQGALYPAVRPKDVKAFDLPVPSIDEQRRIVAEIEKHFSRLDEAVANLQRVKANLKRYKAAVLKAAVEGRLVDTEAELAKRSRVAFGSGEQRGAQVLAEREAKARSHGKYKAPVPYSDSELPELPYGWIWLSLDACCVKITDGTHHSPANFSEGEYKYITSKNVREFRLDLDAVTYIDKATHEEIYARCDVLPGDVLYVKDGANTGLAAVNTLKEPFSLLSSVGVFRTVSTVIPEYLVAYLNCQSVRDRMLANIAGVAITRLTLSKLKSTAVAVPPLGEQRRIVAEVDRRLSIVREVETEVDANLQRAQALRQATLSKAFSTR